VLAAAADVVFSDGIPPEFLDQWTEETCFLLRARHGRTALLDRTGRQDAPGRSNR
jgi:hypothetical protein